MFCSNCNKEYDEGIMVCDICGEPLLGNEVNEVEYLLTVSDETEKAIVEDILKDANINIIEKINMPLGSIIGAMPLGIDIYVRKEDWKLAREILESDDFESEGIDELTNAEEIEEDYDATEKEKKTISNEITGASITRILTLAIILVLLVIYVIKFM